MAISLIAKPSTFHPAYNKMVFQYSSTNVNNTGFRFVFDLYETGGAKFHEERVLPRYSDGYGCIDLSKVLQNKVTYTYPSGTTETAVANSAFQYTLKIGEEYVTEFSWTANLVQNGSYTKITCTHSFVVGDQVVIDAGVANPNLTGLFTVTAITGTTDFTVNCLWTQIADATGNGSVKYSDNRKTVTRDIRTETAGYAFDGAVPYSDFITWNGGTYLLNSTSDKFLTTCPRDGIKIADKQDFYILVGNNAVTNGYLVFQNDGGDTMNYAITNNDVVTMCNVGWNANPSTVTSGTAGHIKDSTLYYDVWFADNVLSRKSEKIRFYIDRRCAINDYKLMFYDRLGSWGSFPVQLRVYKRGNVNKQTYNKDLTGYVSSQQWNAYAYETGNTVIFPQVDESLELNTNFMTVEESRYFAELLSSPQVYISIDTNIYACVVQDTGYDIQDSTNPKLIRKTVTVKLANQTPING